MPNRDGTGPRGNGRPGKGLGPCGRFERTNCRGFGHRHGRKMGFHHRCRCGCHQPFEALPPRESKEFYLYERDNLEARKAELEEQLRWLNEQLEKEEGKES